MQRGKTRKQSAGLPGRHASVESLGERASHAFATEGHLKTNFDGQAAGCMERGTVEQVYRAAHEFMANTGELELCRA